MMVKWALYQPNVHPDEMENSLSVPDTHRSFLPSAPMLLRRDEALSPDSMLVGEAIMPVMTYLDKENEILRRDGMETWLKPRTEQVPITKELSYEKRSLDALFTWSRPLLEDDEDKSFMDFFETLEDDEYVYDPVTGNWIFENAGTLGDGVVSESGVQEDGAEQVTAFSDTELDKEEGVVQARHDGDSLVLEVPSEMEPWLRRFVEEEGTKDDDRDDPSVPVYV